MDRLKTSFSPPFVFLGDKSLIFPPIPEKRHVPPVSPDFPPDLNPGDASQSHRTLTQFLLQIPSQADGMGGMVHCILFLARSLPNGFEALLHGWMALMQTTETRFHEVPTGANHDFPSSHVVLQQTWSMCELSCEASPEMADPPEEWFSCVLETHGGVIRFEEALTGGSAAVSICFERTGICMTQSRVYMSCLLETLKSNHEAVVAATPFLLSLFDQLWTIITHTIT